MPDLIIHELSVSYRRAGQSSLAVDTASLQLPEGTTLGLVGESGSGKSSLGKAIVGLAPISSGTIELDGIDISQPAAARTRTSIQMVFQDPRSSLNPRMTVAKTLSEALNLSDRALGRRGTRQRSRAAELLDSVALPARYLDSYPRELSGGQRQRVALARALAREPQVIVADEITSALDVSVQASILELIVQLQLERGISFLFISHNLAVVRYLSDTVAVMQGGKIVETGTASAVLDNPSHEYTQKLRSSVVDLHLAQ